MALFFTDYALGWLGLRDGCWKFLLELDSKRSQLFDVCRDPARRPIVAAQSPSASQRIARACCSGWRRSARAHT